MLNWTDSTTQGASAYIAPCRKIWSFWQRNNQDVRLFPWSGSLFSIQEEVFFSVTTQWLNACTWELASRNFLDGLSVTIKAFSQLCKAQNGNQEGPLLYRAAHFWVIQNKHKLPKKIVKHKMANKQEGPLLLGSSFILQIVEKKTNASIRKNHMMLQKVNYCPWVHESFMYI